MSSNTSKSKTLRENILLSIEDYLDNLHGEQPNNMYQMVISEAEQPLLQAVMQYANNNQCKAAEILGINRNTLRKKLQLHGLI